MAYLGRYELAAAAERARLDSLAGAPHCIPAEKRDAQFVVVPKWYEPMQSDTLLS